ncbi:sigma-70 family RNA polymerase sigma factor [Humitalea sp. 24SJ18S-53]|uniref:sigma-70 family RNA polymerase sigma factor n=1 Tax=Humitalea sp. 24SJ18S-53 TaxID=3422307 RepID=UPI003D67718B
MEQSRSEMLRQALMAMMPGLRGYARALTRDTHAADDLVQEAVMRALAAEVQWQDGTEPRPWVFTILRNAWLGGLRQARNGRRAATENAHASADHAAETQSGQAALHELSVAMDRLPATQREALMLVGAQGLSTAEAAAICGVAEGTIKARVSHGRRSLRIALGH